MGDHFNWPALQRKDLMSLSKIVDEETFGLRKLQPKRDSSSLKNEDIDGAKSFYRHTKYLQKETFVNKCDDINEKDRSSSPRYKNQYFMRVDDIDGAQAQRKFMTTRVTDPLNPVYVLPSFEKPAPYENKFIRDTLYIRDIKGASATPDYKYLKERNVNPYTEIEGSKTKQRFIPKDAINSLDVKGINNEGLFRTTRQTNPLDPKYNISTADPLHKPNQFDTNYGFIDGSISRIRHPDLSKEKSLSLATKDILGAHANALPEKHVHLNNKRKDFIEINKIDDIPGAQKSTLKKGIQTNRMVDPNIPAYILPGHSEDYTNYQRKRSRNYSLMNQTNFPYGESNTNQSMSISRRVQLEPLNNQNTNSKVERSKSTYSQQSVGNYESLNKTTFSIMQIINQQFYENQINNIIQNRQDQVSPQNKDNNSNKKTHQNNRDNSNLRNMLNQNSNKLLQDLEKNDISYPKNTNKSEQTKDNYKSNAQKLDSFINKSN